MGTAMTLLGWLSKHTGPLCREPLLWLVGGRAGPEPWAGAQRVHLPSQLRCHHTFITGKPAQRSLASFPRSSSPEVAVGSRPPPTLPDPTPWGPLTPPCQLTGPLPTLTTGPAHSRPGPQPAHLRHVLLGPTHLVLSVLWLSCTPPPALPHSRQPWLQSSRQGFGASCHPSNPPQALLFPLNCLSCCGGSYS